jgi:endonuclease III
VIPLDTHVLRISRYIGLTERRTASWATALDVTASLRRLSPEDPTRYDFAIAQLGISRGCLHRRVPETCGECPLDAVCSLPR